jgi:gliding-associated putative ABC transporter substrate-binding component GldG
MKRKSFVNYVLLVAGVMILVNILADRYFLRLDFTADKRYTLSEATRNILGSLKENITITAYFSEELPPDFIQLRRDFKEELIEYANRSNGKIIFDFINPNKDEQTEQQAMQAGVNPILINVREKDQVKQQKAYLGAVLKSGDKTEVIPLIQPGAAMEYALSTSIKKMTVAFKPKIGFIEGHGESSLNSMVQVLQSLSILYDVQPLNLATAPSDLSEFKTLVIVSPRDTFPPSDLQKLDNFLAQGKNIFIAMNRVDGNFQTMNGNAISTGLEAWLESKGLKVNPDFVIDQSCGSVMVNQQQGYMTFQSSLNFPYLPMVTKFADNPATKGLTQIVFQFASSLDYKPRMNNLTYTPLVITSEKSGKENAPVQFRINRNWQQSDFRSPGLVLGAALTGPISGNLNSKLIVITDGDFALNGEGQQARQIPQDNLNLFVNSIDWLSDDTGLIELRTKEVKSRPLDQMEDGKKTLLKYLNFLVPILLILGYGLFRWQYRRNQRMNRMNENFV